MINLDLNFLDMPFNRSFKMLFLFQQARSSIYSFDFGSKNVRVAVGVPGKAIEVMANDQSARFTPNYIAYSLDSDQSNASTAEWFSGIDAQRIISKNSSHGVKNPYSYLGTDQKFPMEGMDPITVSSMSFLLHLRKYKKKRDKLIIAVPPIYSPQSRRALVKSLKALNISNIQLIDSNVAVASIYAVERTKKDENITKRVLFIDIGAVSAEASLFKFTREGGLTSLELENYRFTDEVGGDLIDQLLYENVTKALSREPTSSESSNLLRQIIRTKERLAGGGESFVDLTEDFQIRVPMTNQIIAEVSQEPLSKFREFLSGMDTPDEIELVGGSTRLQCIQSVIQEIFEQVPLKRTLNSDEAVVMGAAYYASLQMGTIIGTRLQLTRPAIYGLDLEVSNGKNVSLFKSGETDSRKAITLRKFNDFQITMHLTKAPSDNLLIKSQHYDNAKSVVETIKIVNLRELTRNLTSQLAKGTKPFLRFMFGQSTIVDDLDMLSGSLNANITLNISIQGEYKASDSTTSSWTLSQERIDSFEHNETFTNSFILEYLIANSERKKHAAALHKLEAFVIDLTDKAEYDPDFAAVTTEEERSEIRSILMRERQAIELSGSRVSVSDLEKRYDKLEEKIEMPLLRYREYQGRPSMLAKLNKTIKKANEAIEKAVTDQSRIDDFKEYINLTMKMMKDAAKIDPHGYPKITVQELKERDTRINRQIPDMRIPAQKKKTVTISTDPNSPDYNPEALEKLGIHIEKPKSESVNQTETNETDAENSTIPNEL